MINAKIKEKIYLIIRNAIEQNRWMLMEDEAKKILSLYGIPTVLEKRVYTKEEVVRASKEIGFPVVIKALGEKLSHKTELGLVKLDIINEEVAKKSTEEIIQKAGSSLEAILVQKQIKASREIVMGLTRDENFGPMIMFGIGGIYTEALNDITFRGAPLDDVDIELMQEEIKANAILKSYRGEEPANKKTIETSLKALSQIALDFEEIAEIDINPLLLSKDGSLTAVDALIILKQKNANIKNLPAISPEKIRKIFYPKSIALIGASDTLGKWGNILFMNIVNGGYKGDIYLVNPKGKKIAGKKVYKDIDEIENNIDLAIVTIPAKYIMDLIQKLKEKKINAMLLITSGFREVSDEGKILEEKIVDKARKSGIIIIGPNTMGICNPHINFFPYWAPGVRPKAGSTAFVAQSGNIGIQLLTFADQQDIGIRAFSGSGNEAMVTIEDYLEAFEKDVITKTIVMYIESLKNAQRFFASAKKTARKKPIVVLKSGRTKAGIKAAASHTGALSSDFKLFNALCKQNGIVQVKKPIELLDLSAVFSSLPLPKGNRIAIMTLGGGWGVVAADLCAENNLVLPTLPDEIMNKFNKILPDFWSHSNPVDMVGESEGDIIQIVLETLLRWDGCDAVINLGIHGKRIVVNKMVEAISTANPKYPQKILEMAKKEKTRQENDFIKSTAILADKYDKPVVGVSFLTDEKSRKLYTIKDCKNKAVFFSTPERAVKALAGMCQYAKWRDSHIIRDL